MADANTNGGEPTVTEPVQTQVDNNTGGQAQPAPQVPPVTEPQQTQAQVQPNTAQKTAEPTAEQTQNTKTDEFGRIITEHGALYTEKSVQELMAKQGESNKRLALQNRMLVGGVDAEMAETLSNSIEVSKLDNFDFSKFVVEAGQAQPAPIEPKKAGSGIPTPAEPTTQATEQQSRLERAREAGKKLRR